LKGCISITESSLVSGIETLRSPTSNLTLKLITFALGSQFYLCPANSTSSPIPNGTNATLIDATPYFNNILFDKIPLLLLAYTPTTVHEKFGPEIGKQVLGGSLTSSFQLNDFSTFQGRVFETIRAPNPNDDLDWVAITTTVVNSTLKEVYCVQTAAGLISPSQQCDVSPYDAVITRPYAAEYWFYG